MKSQYQLLSPFLYFFLSMTSILAVDHRPRPFGRSSLREQNDALALVPLDFQTHFYEQTLDHFNYGPESYVTFKQRYVVNSKYWGGAAAKAPIFVYLGAEAALDDDLLGIGFLNENAPHFKALVVYIEHRFYGQSVPFGSFIEAIQNDTVRGYFNSAQALADYAEVLLHLKKQLSADNSPIIVVGGSYGGMLAAWFRLKYPHIAVGALASSAPLLYFDNITRQDGYYSVVTNDFKEASERCYETIKQSWSEIDRVAEEPNGLSILTRRFKTCTRLNKSYDLKDYLDSMYSKAAQYNAPPKYPVTGICDAIDGAPEGTDVLGRIFAGVVAFKGDKSCYDTNEGKYFSETNVGWSWQRCSEMVMPIVHGVDDTMFPPERFDLKSFITQCQSTFGVSPRPHWITNNYGGQDIKLVLQRFASNIIFSNGLKDPYSSGGVLENISDSIIAVVTANGSHALDILPSRESDPKWLVMQRQIEVNIIEGWIRKYNADIGEFRQ